MPSSPDARRASDAGIDLDLGARARAPGPISGQDRGDPVQAYRRRDERPRVDNAAGVEVDRSGETGRGAENADRGDVLEHERAGVDQAGGAGEAHVNDAFTG